ncbi:MAG: DUF5684 domain-containing protein [Minisyncoccales bacterium]
MLKKYSSACRRIILCFTFSILFLVGGLNIAFAQTSLPTAGNSFSSAVLLSPGEYQGGHLDDSQVLYYSISVKPGQKISVEASSFDEAGCSMYLYSSGQEELISSYDENPKVSWLAGTSGSSGYYLKIENDHAEIASFTVKVSATNYYDAGSQTDAGDTFDRALTVGTGTYSSYLAGNAYITSVSGDDAQDIYKVSLKKGSTYSFKLSPSSKTELTLSLYDINKQLIEEDASANKGAAVSLSLTPAADTYVYISALNEFYAYQEEIVNYTLEIKTSVPLTKFYSCADDYCGYVGEFASLSECQSSTTKTCYTSSTCNGVCSGGGVEGCIKSSDCPINNTCMAGQCIPEELPVCEDECSADQTKCFDNFNYYKCGDFDSDNCLEWSTPAYCGEGNKCQGEKCSKSSGGCMCSAWVGTECGSGECGSDKIFQTRTCTPQSCDITEQCLSASSCGIIPPPPDGGDNSFEVFLTFLGTLPVWSWFSGWYLLLWIVFYAYLAFCLQILAQRTNTPNSWLAWIPIGNIFLMISIAQKPMWWILLFLIPLVNIVIAVIIWMAISERRGKPNWLGILILISPINLFIIGYLAFFDYKSNGKIEPTPPYAPTGTEAADKPTVGYKHLCKYCDKLIPPDSVVCPFCEKVNPLGPSRCPKCHEPIEKEWKVCSKCNLNLRIICPFCGKTTFFGEHCEDCGARLMVICPNCNQEQPPLGDNCMKCGKSLTSKEKNK